VGEITDALRRARGEAPAPLPGPARPEPRAAEPAGAPSRRSAPAEPAPEPGPIAEVPRTLASGSTARAVVVPEKHVVAESFRQFALQVRPLIERRANRCVLVTSALRLEGKTTTASNLALALASLAAERRVALVDLDLRRPSIARGLGIRSRVGIGRVLAGEASLADARIRTDVPALDVFTVEKPRPNAHELLAGQRLPQVLDELRAGYDTVVIDGPPVLLVPDPLLILPHVGACIAVARSGLTLRSAFREMLSRLPQDRLIGCFLNDAPVPRHARRYAAYHYGSEDQPSERVDG
jgi:capsular exopolysaccharide synthesis family protein